MTHWKKILQESVTTPEELARRFNVDCSALEDVIATFPMRINSYYLGLIKTVGDPIWNQAVPDREELHDSVCMADPLAEEDLSPVANLVHKYPDRVLFLVANECAMYCRFCTRKRKVGTSRMLITEDTIQAGIDYIRNNRQIREVLISGGDPLLLSDEKLDSILSRLHSIPTLEVIRIGTRIPCTLPMRITKELTAILKKYHPLYINTHFNHPSELTPEATKACTLLADAGIPLGCQTVLLKGVNDDPETLSALFLGLLRLRVKPYYLFQADLTKGTNHFRTHTTTGIALMRKLIGTISGMAVPTYALDAPEGRGKIPLTPDYIVSNGETLVFHNYLGKLCTYPEQGDPL
ncbi:MAG: KamA family radical SAM protein [Proteobacteria bacterium]|nr:KamA family radical SAM protein [Pseudomonadota bacterium]MBU1231320.1 KamA family radical SAM protein [Pseudomonadota bacterium]MBU1420364.1 KamA family radical SAM protein [Pseudomonadota bacterium]MBU1454374.1 KamA family radical SAM protein [Pseudomonadota bacterium]